ncbi:MAG: glycoside hydrolase family 3 N-terminal domain-containing protein [Halodesulfurarchaeum sp.]
MANETVKQNVTAPTERRIDTILAAMTLEEKAAQLGSVTPRQIGTIPEQEMLDDDGELVDDVVAKYLENGIGHLTQVASQGLLDPESAAETINELQTYLVEETRLGIPAIEHEECLAGYRSPGGTAYPQSIGLASTWSPTLLESITDSIRRRLEAVGTTQALSPVLDVSRDMRWGRVEETFGEDPQLVGALGAAYVSGLQSDGEGIDATLKHFAAHGSGEGGKNRSSVQIGERELREVHLYPFEVAIQVADARAVMNAYHDIDGVPCASSEWLLTDVLRGEWGFDGHVVADYFSVDLLKEEHGIATSQREAGVAALEAGLDVELPATDCYGENLVEAVEAGELSEATLETAVRRVLRAKIESGVFDDPYVDPEAASAPFDTDEQSELAARAARESMTLLENDGILPLSDEDLDTVALVGPQADDGRGQVGDYTHAARFDSEGDGDFSCVTPRDALDARAEKGGFELRYIQGATMTGPSTEEFDAAEAAVADADVAVLCVGARSDIDFADRENPAELPDVPTSGENADVTDLGLPGVQEALVERLLATDTPVVVVLVSGKPHAIPEIADRAPALLHAWLPGEKGGTGIVDVLFGEYNPSGHLPVSIPKSVGQQPVYYSRKPNSANERHVYVDGEPLYPFGYGLSYTDFEYDDLSLDVDSVGPMGSLSASVTVTNTGDLAGHDVVQLYQHAANPSQARPIQELVGFQRLALDPGETKRVTFHVDVTQLAYHDLDMNLTVEEGPYELRVGQSASDIESTAGFEITDTKTVPRSARTYLTGTDVEPAE